MFIIWKHIVPLVLLALAATAGAAGKDVKATRPARAKAKNGTAAPANKPAKPKPAAKTNQPAKANPSASIPPAGPEDLAYLERAGAGEIVFAVRSITQEHWYANFGYYAFGTDRKAYGKNGKLCKLNLGTGKLDTLIDDPEGAVRDPIVDYDGRSIIFAWRKGGGENFHLYDMNADGTGIRQLTDGPFDDFEPSTLPGGGLVFVSSRCRRWVNCWVSQVANLHRCDRDGRNIRPLSANIEQDNTPWVLPDGRILYMRWEYVDRSQVNYHHLWTMNPDGTGQAVFYGNQTPSNVYLDAKPIPGTGRVVLSKSPGHGRTEHEGALATVDDRHGPDDPQAIETLTKEANYRDPWPLDAGHFLAAREGALMLVNAQGGAVKLYELAPPVAPQERTITGAAAKPEKGKPQLWLHEPRPLRARPREAVIAPRTEPDRATGRFMLSNAALGRNMAGVAPGEIKKLLVIESLPKPANFTGGMDPLSYVGTFTLERVLGTVPVEPDGSAYFEAPALRSLLFVALDEKDLAVKRMQSFTTVMPGETLGCVGCHEARTTAGSGQYRKPPRAATRPASRIEPVAGVPDVLDFPRDIQPILNRHCLQCHASDKRRGGVLLSGDHGPMFSHGYYSLVVWGQVADGRNLARSNYPPRALGSGGSALMNKLAPAHHGVMVSERERRTVALWLDTGAPYPGTYAALGTGTIGGYQQNKENQENDQDWPEARKAREAFARSCAACHNAKEKTTLPQYLADENELSFWEPKMNDPRLKRDRHIVFDLTRPEQSLYLLAPLARAAGGYGICRPRSAPKGAAGNALGGVIGSRRDPDYQALLAMIEAGRRRLEEIKRFDMPGFRPRQEYVREMKRFGVLPAQLDAKTASIDIYATDRKYWDLFIWPY